MSKVSSNRFEELRELFHSSLPELRMQLKQSVLVTFSLAVHLLYKCVTQ